ncbi:MAG: TIGR03936 family radical SAM-associated protein [Oscillospiraceae bacterium]
MLALITVRVWFTKVDEAAYISLLDLQRVMGRALKRSKLPVWYSQGFNPHVYMTFSAPLALGQESLVESMDFKTEAETLDWDTAKTALAAALPRGICVQRVEPANMSADKIAFAQYVITWNEKNIELQKKAISAYNEQDIANVEKKTKKGVKTVDLKQYVEKLNIEDDKLNLLLPTGNLLNINPELLLEFLHTLGGAQAESARILRTKLLTENKELFL